MIVGTTDANLSLINCKDMKKYFIGVDVSKEKIDVSVVMRKEESGSIVRLGHSVFENRKRGFLQMLKWGKSLCDVRLTNENSLFCCETTGSYDLKLCHYVHTKELFMWRENAIQLKRSMGLRRGKNDIADAWAIAEYALRHEDKAVEFNPILPEVKELKILVNYRQVIVNNLKAAKVRAKETLDTSVATSDALRFIIREARKEIRSLEKRLKACEEQIRKLIAENDALNRNFKHLISVKGIGLVNAAALIAYTNNFKNFQTANALATYMGLTAFREMSGTSVNKAVKVGCYSNRQLKAYITAAAECAARYNPRISEYYNRMLSLGKHHGVALNNVKNKLVHILFSLVKHDCDYEENHEIITQFNKWKAS